MIRKWMALTAAAACSLLVLVSTTVAGDGTPGCCPDADCTKTVCQPVTKNKVVTKRVFSERREEFCPCPVFGCLFKKCGCGHVRTKKLLILKIRKSDKCVTECAPVTAPACPGACTVTPCAPAALPGAPAGQPAIITLPAVPAGMPPVR